MLSSTRSGTGRLRGHRFGARLRRGAAPVALLALVAASTSGCTTVAEHRKLERRVVDLERDRGVVDARERMADVAADVDELRSLVREFQGQIDEVRRLANEGLVEARKARREAATAGGRAGAGGEAAGASPGGTARTDTGGRPEPDSGSPAAEDLSAEVQAYQAGLTAWRDEDYPGCIDRFRSFLQTYASSLRADDAAFWMADCHYKQGEYKNAVLRFDDVVRNYPDGNRAPDALYRQGESLLKLGPGFREAARRAFERVLKEYPDSTRAKEAHRQLELHGAG
jgi:tol-pal system protein YbgF